jgi:hypothetical protein
MQVGHQPQQSPSLQRPSADVFGSGHAIPRVQVQRPSLDLAHPSHDVNTRRIPRSRSESEGPLGEHRDE